MTTALHSVQGVADGNHVIQSLGPYANEAARLAATANAQGTTFSSVDLGRVALQTDTFAAWMLVGLSPTRWKRVAGEAPIRPQSGAGAYTCTLDDAGALVAMTSASANAPTIPPNSSVAYALGDEIMFEQVGAGLMTVTAGAGVTFEGNYTGSPSSAVSNGQGAVLCAKQRILNTWCIFGRTT